ncbi:MAG: NUDIX domain-containing protein [Fulvimarina manganoxydans]|uniref:NUDIX domain-containing protein n=1 Tax=Fulvimarina manganoxydans TaxID=937218 RepID=UPI00235692C8|nr:NUDIX domain-containing protein [Fulvimarina manganoxydans]MCK5932403.1 NUDIX domain-containing protein [Fulvimarina manganoxydans]
MQKILVRAFHLAHLMLRPMTLGVRVAAFDESGRLFLVRHTYVRGWHLPGGGVDPGETIEAAAHRELAEEGNLSAQAPLRLVSLHHNAAMSRRDHVAFYVCDRVSQSASKTSDREIAEAGFFPLDALPEGLTGGTKRRLDEWAGRAEPDPLW